MGGILIGSVSLALRLTIVDVCLGVRCDRQLCLLDCEVTRCSAGVIPLAGYGDGRSAAGVDIIRVTDGVVRILHKLGVTKLYGRIGRQG